MKNKNILYDIYLYPLVNKTKEEMDKEADELFKLADENLSNRVEEYNYDAREGGQEECWAGLISWGDYPDFRIWFQIETNLFDQEYFVPVNAGEDIAEFFYPSKGNRETSLIRDYKIEIHWNYTDLEQIEEITPEIQEVMDTVGIGSFENFYIEEHGYVQSGVADYNTGYLYYFDD